MNFGVHEVLSQLEAVHGVVETRGCCRLVAQIYSTEGFSSKCDKIKKVIHKNVSFLLSREVIRVFRPMSIILLHSGTKSQCKVQVVGFTKSWLKVFAVHLHGPQQSR